MNIRFSCLLFFLINSALLANYSKEIRITEDIRIIQISSNAFVHITIGEFPGFGKFPCNGVIYRNGSEAFLFDSPVNDSLTAILIKGIKDSLGLTVTGFIPNHWHNDCMGGLSYVKSRKIKSYANQMTIDIATAKNLPLPDSGFSDSLIIDFDGRKIELYYPGAAHSTDNITIWLPEEKVLFPGCIVKSSDSRNIGNVADGDINSYPSVLEKLLDKFPDAKIVVPGHGNYGGLELIRFTNKLLKR